MTTTEYDTQMNTLQQVNTLQSKVFGCKADAEVFAEQTPEEHCFSAFSSRCFHELNGIENFQLNNARLAVWQTPQYWIKS